MPTKWISKSSPKRKLPLQRYISKPPSSKKCKSTETLRKEKKEVKAARNVVLDHIVKSTVDTRKENDGKTPHKFVQNIVESHHTLCPWVTRHVINEKIAARIDLDAKEPGSEAIDLSKEQRDLDTVDLASESRTSTIPNPIDCRKKGGRPKGSTNERKRTDQLCIIAG